MKTNKPTLVILAAGVGSRYGGLKQLETFTPEGDTIMDFSIYDAIQAGFGKLIFIIRKNIEIEFKEVFTEKLENTADVAYVFQELDSIPKKFQNPQRKKPWGTGHALLMAKDLIKGNFAIINADDFYGREAFEVMARELMKTKKDSYNFHMIAYLLKNTVSEYGFVSRGICQVDCNNYLTKVTERTHIEKIKNQLKFKNDDGEFISIDENKIVSMNFWGFTPKYFEFGTKLFEEFLEKNFNKLKKEFLIPRVVNEILKSGFPSVKVLNSNAKWFGVTYKEDKEIVQREIERLRKKKVYPSKLR